MADMTMQEALDALQPALRYQRAYVHLEAVLQAAARAEQLIRESETRIGELAELEHRGQQQQELLDAQSAERQEGMQAELQQIQRRLEELRATQSREEAQWSERLPALQQRYAEEESSLQRHHTELVQRLRGEVDAVKRAVEAKQEARVMALDAKIARQTATLEALQASIAGLRSKVEAL